MENGIGEGKALTRPPVSADPTRAAAARHPSLLSALFEGKLRTKFLLSLLLISAALTWATLLLVRHRVRLHVREEIFEALSDSVTTFQRFQYEREIMLTRSAALLAGLSSLKALMTTRHAATIQDASTEFWRQIGSDLFVLSDRSGRLMALNTATAGITRDEAQNLLLASLRKGDNRDWWFGSGRLFQVFIQPIYFGSPADNTLLGVLAVGYEIDDRVAEEVSRIASSRVAFRRGNSIVVSTLSPVEQSELTRLGRPRDANFGAQDIQLGDERFLSTSVDLAPGIQPRISLTVLESYDQATAFLESLNHWILGVGLAAVLAGSALVFLISDTFTRPLSKLVAGVHALEKGDFRYPLEVRGRDEVSELTAAFSRMRHTLQETQQDLLRAERLATIGRMASTISHDLRHPLTAILAYAEFLSEGNLDFERRQTLFQEIRLAVNRMTEQLSSLLGFSKGREALRPVYGDIAQVAENAIQSIRARPEFRHVTIMFSHEGSCEAWFDTRQLERVFQNLLVNACEAVSSDGGKVEIRARAAANALEIRIADNGGGIAPEIQNRLFQPFVSYGKEKGFGLGLTVVQKIVQDHGGSVSVERTGPDGTVFVVTLPRSGSPQELAVT